MSRLAKRKKYLETVDESVKFKHLHRRDWPDISGKILLWQLPRTSAEFLASLVRKKQPNVILELGTSGGYSGLWMLEAAENAHLHTIEYSPYRFKIAKETFQEAGVQDRVTQYQEKIEVVLADWSQSVDFVFIDAGKQFYLDHFKRVEPHLKAKAIIVIDNMLDSREKTDNLWEYVKHHPDYSWEMFEEDNGMLVVYLN